MERTMSSKRKTAKGTADIALLVSDGKLFGVVSTNPGLVNVSRIPVIDVTDNKPKIIGVTKIHKAAMPLKSLVFSAIMGEYEDPLTLPF